MCLTAHPASELSFGMACRVRDPSLQRLPAHASTPAEAKPISRRRACRSTRISLPRSSGDEDWRTAEFVRTFNPPLLHRSHLSHSRTISSGTTASPHRSLFAIGPTSSASGASLIPIATKNRKTLAFEHVRRRLSRIISSIWLTRRAMASGGQVVRAACGWSGSGGEFGESAGEFSSPVLLLALQLTLSLPQFSKYLDVTLSGQSVTPSSPPSWASRRASFASGSMERLAPTSRPLIDPQGLLHRALLFSLSFLIARLTRRLQERLSSVVHTPVPIPAALDSLYSSSIPPARLALSLHRQPRGPHTSNLGDRLKQH